MVRDDDEPRPPGSDYYLVLRYLASIKCAICQGVGGVNTKTCKNCKGTGFREGDVHFLISGRQTRRGR